MAMADEKKRNEKKRLDNLDLIKAIGILMVLTLHVPLWNVDFIETPSLSRIIQYAFRLISEGVPIFVMVNGFLLFMKRSFDLKRHMLKTIRMFVLLLIWCVILTVLGMAIDQDPEPITVASIANYLMATQVGSRYTGVLWFLQSLIALYLVYPVLKAVYDGYPKLFDYMFIVTAVFTVGMNTFDLLRDALSLKMDVTPLANALLFVRRSDPTGNGWYVYYFLLGGMLFKYKAAVVKKRWLWATLGLLSWIGAFFFGYALSIRLGFVYNQAFNYSSIFMTFFIIGLFAFSGPYQCRGTIVQRFIASVGQNTFGIYLCHFIFIFAAYRFYTLDTGGRRFLAFIIIFILSHVSSYLARKVPVLKELFILG